MEIGTGLTRAKKLVPPSRQKLSQSQQNNARAKALWVKGLMGKGSTNCTLRVLTILARYKVHT